MFTPNQDIQAYYPFLPVENIDKNYIKFLDVHFIAYVPCSEDIQLNFHIFDTGVNQKLLSAKFTGDIVNENNATYAIVDLHIGNYSIKTQLYVIIGKDTKASIACRNYVRLSDIVTLSDLPELLNKVKDYELSLDTFIIQQAPVLFTGLYVNQLNTDLTPVTVYKADVKSTLVFHTGYNVAAYVTTDSVFIGDTSDNTTGVSDTTATKITLTGAGGYGKGRVPMDKLPIINIPSDIASLYGSGLCDINDLSKDVPINSESSNIAIAIARDDTDKLRPVIKLTITELEV